MLPERHLIDDRRWITQQLQRLPAHLRKKAAHGYSAVYGEVYDAEPEERFRAERARFAANSRLREYVSAVHKAATPKS